VSGGQWEAKKRMERTEKRQTELMKVDSSAKERSALLLAKGNPVFDAIEGGTSSSRSFGADHGSEETRRKEKENE